MKNLPRAFVALLLSVCITAYSCGPNDNKGGMDEANSNGEGAIDSTRLTNFDSTSNPTGDTSAIK